MDKVDLLPPSIKHLQFGRFLRNGKNHTGSSKFYVLDWECCSTYFGYKYEGYAESFDCAVLFL